MRVVLSAAFVAIIILFVLAFVTRVRTRSGAGADATTLATAQREAIEPETYRNHLGMARWIEGRLGDDLVRTSLDADDEARARRLLAQFYGEDD